MKEIKAIIQPFKLGDVIAALQALNRVGCITVFDVQGYGREQDHHGHEVPMLGASHHLPRKMVLLVVNDADAPAVTTTIERSAHTGKPGDGKVFVSDILEAVRVRTGERGEAAL